MKLIKPEIKEKVLRTIDTILEEIEIQGKKPNINDIIDIIILGKNFHDQENLENIVDVINNDIQNDQHTLFLLPDVIYEGQKVHQEYILKKSGYIKKIDMPEYRRFFIFNIDELKKYMKENSSKTQDNKIKLTIDSKNKTISKTLRDGEIVYNFRKFDGKNKRFEYLIKIVQNKKIGASKLSKTTYQNISSEISNINKNIKTELKLKENLITNKGNTGYEINKSFDIELI